MRCLLIKTSSLGDVIHTLPALNDALYFKPDIKFDWIVEENFQTIASWHPAVEEIIPIALRRWRKNPKQAVSSGEIVKFLQKIRAKKYDLIIDAQGLLKSAWIAAIAKGPSHGLNWTSAREHLASIFYRHKHEISWDIHATERTRQLFAASLGYDLPEEQLPSALHEKLPSSPYQKPYLVFLHGTTWPSKHWPVEYWQELARIANEAKYSVLLPWGSPSEKERAEAIQQGLEHIVVLPSLNLSQIAGVLAAARGVVAMDTGLGHLCASLGTPCISLYGPTDPDKTGTHGLNQLHIRADFPNCAPCLQEKCTYTGESNVKPACFANITPERVWHKLLDIIK